VPQSMGPTAQTQFQISPRSEPQSSSSCSTVTVPVRCSEAFAGAAPDNPAVPASGLSIFWMTGGGACVARQVEREGSLVTATHAEYPQYAASSVTTSVAGSSRMTALQKPTAAVRAYPANAAT
jgi:hypothetical protein